MSLQTNHDSNKKYQKHVHTVMTFSDNKSTLGELLCRVHHSVDYTRGGPIKANPVFYFCLPSNNRLLYMDCLIYKSCMVIQCQIS